jgi:hypothetical protein
MRGHRRLNSVIRFILIVFTPASIGATIGAAISIPLDPFWNALGALIFGTVGLIVGLLRANILFGDESST